LNLSTSKQQRSAKRLLRILSKGKLIRSKVVDKLVRPVKVQKSTGQIVELEPIYKNRTDAKNFIQDLIQDDSFPIEKSGNYVQRSDLKSSEKKSMTEVVS